MPRVEMKPLTPEAQALAMRIHELLKDAKAGEMVTLPPGLAQAIDDSVREACAPEILARRRLEWLHSRDSHRVDGYEWGIFRVKWENGRAVEVWQTNGDFSDLDAAMARTAGVSGSAYDPGGFPTSLADSVAVVESETNRSHTPMDGGNG